MKLHEKIIKVIENNGFSVSDIEQQGINCYVELEQDTPLGEDWLETIWFDGSNEDFIDAATKRYYNFDAEEEAEVYITNRGQYGIPNSIRDLLIDAEWKEHMLDLLTDDLALIEI